MNGCAQADGRPAPRDERLLAAAQESAQNIADRATLIATEHAAQNAAQRVISGTAAAGTTEDAAEDVTHPAAGGLGLRARAGAPVPDRVFARIRVALVR